MENRTIAVGLGHASPIAETGEEEEWDRECVCPLVWKCFISEQLISREGHTRQHRSLMDPGPCVVIATGGVLLPNDFLSLSRRFAVPVHLCMACSLGWPINAIQSFRDPFGRYQKMRLILSRSLPLPSLLSKGRFYSVSSKGHQWTDDYYSATNPNQIKSVPSVSHPLVLFSSFKTSSSLLLFMSCN